MRRRGQFGHDVRHERRAAVGQCEPQPVHGLLDLSGLQQDRGVVRLAAEITGFGRALVPGQRCLRIGCGIQPVFEVAGQQVHRFGMAQVCGTGVQGQCLCAVLGHAAAGGQQVGQVVQAPVQAGVGRAPVPHRGQHRVGCGALAQFVAAAQHVHRHRRAVVGGGLVPEPCRRGVLCGAFAFHVHLREQQLCLDLSGLRGVAHACEGSLRIVLQQRGKSVAVDGGTGCHGVSIAGNKNGGRRACRRGGAQLHQNFTFSARVAERPGAMLA